MPNRLIRETSPYLQHHAQNPVDWYPWGAEAFERAALEQKPVLLSVGYAACHWCHVMAEESFADESTARVMNEHFINVKVDREERPDVDRIYQIAQQMLTQRPGGWPLTMFLTHDDQRPFFGGTYFPNEARFGLPGFKDLLARVAEYYRTHQQELREQNAALIRVFEELTPPPTDAELTDAPLMSCRQQLASQFDSSSGGFGGAPKFPHPKSLERLLRHWRASASNPDPDLQALYMATLTLRRMGEGGLNDQLGGGFYRYSVDPHWMIPHFEKMLYDNGALLAVCSEAALATGDDFYRHVAEQIAEWARREMHSEEGGFFSSLDADSEGHEGKFYVWERDEIRALLTEEEYALFAPRFGLDREPNFEGHWHLHTFQAVEGSPDVLESARRKLLAARSKRIWPARDEKILASWNALMIRGLAIAARAFGRDDLATAATEALEFIRKTLWREGRLLATYKDGRAHLNAYLDDYVFLVDAILELQQVRFRADELAFAQELLEVVLRHFADAQNGGFFFTADDHEKLIHRSKIFSDDATPSGNGIAAFVLQRMGHLLAQPSYLKEAERTLRAGWKAIEQHPHAHTGLLAALEELLEPPQIVVLRGGEPAMRIWQQELAKLYSPHQIVLAIPANAQGLPPALAGKTVRGSVVAYVCRGSVCSAPVESFEELVRSCGAGRVTAM
jgi:uncharacterized protein